MISDQNQNLSLDASQLRRRPRIQRAARGF